MFDKILLLYFVIFVCAVFTFVWWIAVKGEKEQIFKLFSYLLFVDGAAYIISMFFVLDNPLQALILLAITIVLAINAANLAKKCDELSDEAITLSAVFKSEPKWAKELRSNRRTIIILSAIWIFCLLAVIDVLAIASIARDKIAGLFVGYTIIISAMILFALIFTVAHNEATTKIRLKTAC